MELLTTLADPRLLATAFLNESAVAWRSGDNQTAERLARKAARYWDHPSTPHGWLVASALARAAGGHAAEAQALAALPQSPEPLYRAQVTRLLQVAGADVPDVPRVEIPPEHAERMLYVLGLGELWGPSSRSASPPRVRLRAPPTEDSRSHDERRLQDRRGRHRSRR
jgi:hypothetical protein